jgi:hypothetical protein
MYSIYIYYLYMVIQIISIFDILEFNPMYSILCKLDVEVQSMMFKTSKPREHKKTTKR